MQIKILATGTYDYPEGRLLDALTASIKNHMKAYGLRDIAVESEVTKNEQQIRACVEKIRSLTVPAGSDYGHGEVAAIAKEVLDILDSGRDSLDALMAREGRL
jgi:hypothetical protein